MYSIQCKLSTGYPPKLLVQFDIVLKNKLLKCLHGIITLQTTFDYQDYAIPPRGLELLYATALLQWCAARLVQTGKMSKTAPQKLVICCILIYFRPCTAANGLEGICKPVLHLHCMIL